ncbi:hypothetical protein B0T24DRAFT_602268 [Lasiosphaeria ovina]|uniref:Uncharacterized protein n=1 Tax=Lasiosphaeria ovina TaxID=92902 RepID=A0AAE0NJI6_9PEZI|nr:hypothetical protein B0T24DRAFT_602268 [Lasiosphaeria ovina]
MPSFRRASGHAVLKSNSDLSLWRIPAPCAKVTPRLICLTSLGHGSRGFQQAERSEFDFNADFMSGVESFPFSSCINRRVARMRTLGFLWGGRHGFVGFCIPLILLFFMLLSCISFCISILHFFFVLSFLLNFFCEFFLRLLCCCYSSVYCLL